MPLDWSPFVELVHTNESFLLTTHIRPDGDGLGSMLALADVLERLGKKVGLTVASTLPARYSFLAEPGRIKRFAPTTDGWVNSQVIIILDTGTWNQLGEFGPFLKHSPAAKVVIDHHPTQDDLGALRFVETTAEATGRLTYEAIRALDEPLSPAAANHLFVALAMDTGWFRHSNATAATFVLAAELVGAGARQTPLYNHLFEENTLPRLKLMGLVLDRLTVRNDGQVAYSEIRRTDYAETRATTQDTEDLVNLTLSLAGVEVGLLFMEQPQGGVKVSFRSRSRLDVGRLAEQFGGGGHRLASGAIIAGSLDQVRTRVLAAVQSALDRPL
jgi:phosphoesterase RecJ-like protein